MRLVIRVEFNNGSIPKLPIAGCHSVEVKNFKIETPLLKKRSDSLPSSNTIPRVIKIEVIEETNKIILMNNSLTLNLFFRFLYSIIFLPAPQ